MYGEVIKDFAYDFPLKLVGFYISVFVLSFVVEFAVTTELCIIAEAGYNSMF
jgi:hypothetical protein